MEIEATSHLFFPLWVCVPFDDRFSERNYCYQEPQPQNGKIWCYLVLKAGPICTQYAIVRTLYWKVSDRKALFKLEFVKISVYLWLPLKACFKSSLLQVCWISLCEWDHNTFKNADFANHEIIVKFHGPCWSAGNHLHKRLSSSPLFVFSRDNAIIYCPCCHVRLPGRWWPRAAPSHSWLSVAAIHCLLENRKCSLQELVQEQVKNNYTSTWP